MKALSKAGVNQTDLSRYSAVEEFASSLTHAAGTALGIAALAVLVSRAAAMNDPWKVVGFSVYGSSLVLLYLSSSLYHALRRPGLKSFFRHMDHSAIYLLIAGTYTPFLLVSLRGPWGWSLLVTIWGLALAGIVSNFFLTGRSRLRASLIYIGMGWLVVVAIKPLANSVPPGGIAWLAAGGLSYTLGVVFYVWRGLPLNHAVWHIFVLGGSVCHFLAVLLYVLPG